LIKVLKNLRDIGNTVIVVKHDEDIIRESDYIIDMGPEGGSYGGKIVDKGTPEHIASNALKSGSYTGYFLKNELGLT